MASTDDVVMVTGEGWALADGKLIIEFTPAQAAILGAMVADAHRQLLPMASIDKDVFPFLEKLAPLVAKFDVIVTAMQELEKQGPTSEVPARDDMQHAGEDDAC